MTHEFWMNSDCESMRTKCKNKMGSTSSTHVGENLKGGDCMGDLCIGGMTILKVIL
jgi:hypothetical protein